VAASDGDLVPRRKIREPQMAAAGAVLDQRLRQDVENVELLSFRRPITDRDGALLAVDAQYLSLMTPDLVRGAPGRDEGERQHGGKGLEIRRSGIQGQGSRSGG
jgi:hypothetical protein